MKPRTIIRTVSFLVLVACLVGTTYVLRPGWFERQEEHVEPLRDIDRSASRGPQYGRAVAIEGDFAAIGVPFFCGNVIDGGAVDIRKRDGNQWNTYTTLRASDERIGLTFGTGLAMTERFIAVVAWGFADDDSESIYIFRREGEPKSPAWVEEAILRPSVMVFDGELQDFPIAIDGDTLVVGAPTQTLRSGVPAEFATGSVFVFEQDADGNWSETAIIRPDVLQEGDQFGMGVDLQADTMVVGAPGRDEAFVFERTDGSWVLADTLSTTSDESEHHFGISVAIEGDRIAVGSGWDWNREGDGNVHTFTRTPENSDWAVERVLTADQPLLGEVVAMKGSILAARARANDPPVPEGDYQASGQPGLVVLFDLKTGKLLDSIGLQGKYDGKQSLYGQVLTLSEHWLLTGAPRFQQGSLPAVGAIQFLNVSNLKEQRIAEYLGPIEDAIYLNRGFDSEYVDPDVLFNLLKDQQSQDGDE